MKITSIDLDDIQKQINSYLSKYEDKSDFVKLVTQVFINDKRFVFSDSELENLSKDIVNIITNISNLKNEDKEKFYFYILKEINNPILERDCLLSCLPDDTTSEFTQKINRYLKNKSTFDDSVFMDFIKNSDRCKLDRFKAYYIMFTFHHDRKDFTKCKEIVDTFCTDFIEYPLWYYTNSQIRYQEEKNKVNADMSEALASAKKCIDIYNNDNRYNPKYPGIYHNFCELVFYASELGDVDSFEENFELAKKYIEEAQNINPKFAKYYYTYGRLLMAKCRYVLPSEASKLYDKAERLYERAIDIEDSFQECYAIKIVDYETALLKCKTERRLKDIDIALAEAKENQKKNIEIQEKTEALVLRLKSLKDELESQKKETLELLGFFSGIISLIMVTSQVVIELDMISATVIMLMFLGILILSFTFFHFIILNGKRKTTKSIVFFVIFGILMIFVALILVIMNKVYG